MQQSGGGGTVDATPRCDFRKADILTVMGRTNMPEAGVLFETYKKHARPHSAIVGTLHSPSDPSSSILTKGARMMVPSTSKHGAKVPRLGLSSVTSSSNYVLESGRQTLKDFQKYCDGERSVSTSLSFMQLCYNCILSAIRVLLYSSFIVIVVLMLDSLEKERRLLLYSEVV